MPLAFMYDPISINRADEGKRVVINLFRTAPLPLIIGNRRHYEDFRVIGIWCVAKSKFKRYEDRESF